MLSPPHKFFDYIVLFISIVSGLTFLVLHYLEGKGTLFSAAVAFCIWMVSVLLLEVFIPALLRSARTIRNRQ
jgi:uncharacterized membrane protein YjjB (DUF3815 family)